MTVTVTNTTNNETDPTATLKLIIATDHPNEITALVNLKALAATLVHPRVQVSICQCSLSHLSILEKITNFIGAGPAVLLIDGRPLTDWSAAYIQFIQAIVERYGPNRLPVLWILRKEQQEDFEPGYQQQRYLSLGEAGSTGAELLWLSRLMPMDFFYPTEQSGVLLTSKLAHLIQIQEWRTRRDQNQRQQKQNERDLLTRITQLEAASHDAIISVDPDYKIISWNKGAENIYGYKAGEVIGKSIGVLGFPKDDLNLDDQLLLDSNTSYEALQSPGGSGSWTGLAIHRSKNGQKLVIESTVTAVKNDLGELIELIGFNRDITLQKNYEQQLLKKQRELVETNSYLKALIEQSPVAIAIFDQDGVCVDINESACKILGVPDASILIGQYNVRTDPFIEKNGNSGLVKKAYEGEVAAFPTQFYDFAEASPEHGMHHRKIILSGKFFPVFNAEGHVQNVVVMEEDITEQHVLANQLLQSQKMEIVSTLVATIAHDFKNLLTLSFTSLDLLRMEVAKKDEELANLPHFDQIETVNEQAKDMLTQLMTFARVEPPRDHLPYNQQAATINEGVLLESVITTNLDLLKRVAGKTIDLKIENESSTTDNQPYNSFSNVSDLDIEDLIEQCKNGQLKNSSYESSNEPTKVVAPTTQISQALMNFVVNAHDAISERTKKEVKGWRGLIQIKTFSYEVTVSPTTGFQPVSLGSPVLHYVVVPPETKLQTGQLFAGLKVTDNGTGIKAEHIEHIFEPLYTTKEIGKGTGLGLASCYAIAHNNGGWLEVESELGSGTSFTLYIPIQHNNALPTLLIEETNQNSELQPGSNIVEDTSPTPDIRNASDTESVNISPLFHTNIVGKFFPSKNYQATSSTANDVTLEVLSGDYTKHQSVILLEPMNDLRRLIVNTLQREGLEVTIAETEEMLMQMFSSILQQPISAYLQHEKHLLKAGQSPSTVPDLLMVDLYQPKYRGFHIASQLLKTKPNTKILFTSAYLNEEMDILVKRLTKISSNIKFLQKPFRQQELLQIISSLDIILSER